MGGNAIKTAERLDKADYLELKGLLSDPRFHHFPYYSDKETFGDMDIVIPIMKRSEMMKMLSENSQFSIIEEVKNTNVTSLGVLFKDKMFQVDLIQHPQEIIPFTVNYYSFNDLGNLIGRLARGVGLKFGHDGLWFTQRGQSSILKEHLLTRDFSEALEYLGLNSERFSAGFKTLEEIFEFVVSSQYYDYARFDLSQRNYRSRTRDIKRPTYNAFLSYVKDNKGTELPPKETFLEQHFARFPVFQCEYERISIIEEQNNIIKAKFNGNIVSAITRLKGKELGVFMKFLKTELSREFLLESSPGKIRDKIKEIYENTI